MKSKTALLLGCWLLTSCVSSTAVSTASTPQEKEASKKQALKARITATMAKQNRIIDSLIAAKDPRLKKDKNGAIIRPNWVSETGMPLYYSTNQRSARKGNKANTLGNGGSLGLNLNGEGIHIGVWDAGHVFDSHDEFTGGTDYFGEVVPIAISDTTAADIWHGHPTNVTSIIIAKGILESENYDITGLAPKLGQIYSYDWNNDVTEIFDQLQTDNNPDFILSNHSYGYPLLDQNDEPIPDQYIGDYSAWSSILDQIAYAYPYYLHVVAGGNDGNISYPTQEKTGLDQLTGSTTAKNVLTVGSFSMDDNNTNITPTGFSSAGPTNDFRIKPELCAAGQWLGVAHWDIENPESTNAYRVSSGTSFAAPGAAGGVALLQQLYVEKFGAYMRGATAKAILCHTADDITEWNGEDITGPDVKTGYGAMNLENAAELILKDDENKNTITEFELTEGQTKTLYFQSLDVGKLVATLSWFDPHAESEATNTLINDLDLRITQENTTYLPWKLPTDVQQTTAVLGDNNADNLEQITISEGLGGVYKITVSHKGTLQDGSQRASLIISGPGVVVTSMEAFEEVNKDGFLVSPMPAKTMLTINVLENNVTFNKIRLLDMIGREVLSVKKASFSRASMEVDVSSVSKGTYILAINTSQKTLFRTIMIF